MLQGNTGTPGIDGGKGEKGDNCTAGPKGNPGDSIKGIDWCEFLNGFLLPIVR